ncbi:MAG: four helix bundle protein [Patescibacteria group bacterium]
MNSQMPFDLEERTALFGESIIKLCKTIKENNITIPIVNQLIRSGTSVGANYSEANNAESRSDFRHKIGICKKEAKETIYWLRMLCTANIENNDTIKPVWQEAKELTLIFSKIFISSK